MTREKNYQILVYVWACFSAWAAFTHLLAPSIISQTWNWGLDQGMQREIGIWNIGFLIFIFNTLRAKISASQFVLPSILTLSTLFAINHALSQNWGGVILNLPVLIWALLIRCIVKS